MQTEWVSFEFIARLKVPYWQFKIFLKFVQSLSQMSNIQIIGQNSSIFDLQTKNCFSVANTVVRPLPVFLLNEITSMYSLFLVSRKNHNTFQQKRINTITAKWRKWINNAFETKALTSLLKFLGTLNKIFTQCKLRRVGAGEQSKPRGFCRGHTLDTSDMIQKRNTHKSAKRYRR